VKDLVNSNKQKYENIYNTINNSSVHSKKEEPSEIQDLSMKNELKNFLKKQLNDDNIGTSISSLEPEILDSNNIFNNESNTFSEFT
jgi:hypothetical protein